MTEIEEREYEFQKRQLLISEIDGAIKKLNLPYSLLVYGSTGRGLPKETSDIDLLIIFRGADTDGFINDDFLPLVGFDGRNSVFDRENSADIKSGGLDFLRLSGKKGGIEIELQFFPLETVRRACGALHTELLVGKKKCEGEYALKNQKPVTIAETFRGKTFLFQTNPVLSPAGQRINVRDIGFIRREGDWSRTITSEKFLFANTFSDSLGIQSFLDNFVLRTFIRTMVYYSDLYVRNNDGKIIGFKNKILNPNRLLDFFEFTSQSGVRKKIEMSPEVTLKFNERYLAQVENMLCKYGWRLYE